MKPTPENKAKLISWLTFNGIKRIELAEAIGVSEQTIGKKLKGETDFTISEATEICNRFGIPVSLFFDNLVAKTRTES